MFNLNESLICWNGVVLPNCKSDLSHWVASRRGVLNPAKMERRGRFQWIKVLRIFFGKCHTHRGTKYAYSWWRKHSHQPTKLSIFLWNTHLFTQAQTNKHTHTYMDNYTNTFTFTNTEPDEHTHSLNYPKKQWWCWQHQHTYAQPFYTNIINANIYIKANDESLSMDNYS